MPYPDGISRIVAGGFLFGPTGDDWATTLHVRSIDGNNNNPPIDAVGDAFSAWFSSQNARISQGATLTYVKANRIDGDGRYVFPNTNEKPLGAGQGVGGARSGLSFPQISVAVSLLAAESRGYATRGRFYPPMNVIDLASDGHISPGMTQEIATAAASLITQLQTGAMAGYRVVIASKRGGNSRPVARVAVGDVVDNQRRRRQSLVEKYYEVPTAGASDQPGGGLG